MKPFNQLPAHQKTGSVASCMALVMGVLLTSLNPEASANDQFIDSMSRVTQYVESQDVSHLKGNVSIIQQQGTSNSASVVQSRSANYQFKNFAYIKQSGYNNQANLIQHNGNNIGVIVQQGYNNSVTAIQEGNSVGVALNAIQIGFNSNLMISQSGSGLRDVNVHQQNYSGTSRPVTIDIN